MIGQGIATWIQQPRSRLGWPARAIRVPVRTCLMTSTGRISDTARTDSSAALL